MMKLTATNSSNMVLIDQTFVDLLRIHDKQKISINLANTVRDYTFRYLAKSI